MSGMARAVLSGPRVPVSTRLSIPTKAMRSEWG